MPIRCPKGTKPAYRYKKGTRIRIGGCMKRGRFVKMEEFKKIPKKSGSPLKKINYIYDSGKKGVKKPRVKEPATTLFDDLLP